MLSERPWDSAVISSQTPTFYQTVRDQAINSTYYVHSPYEKLQAFPFRCGICTSCVLDMYIWLCSMKHCCNILSSRKGLLASPLLNTAMKMPLRISRSYKGDPLNLVQSCQLRQVLQKKQESRRNLRKIVIPREEHNLNTIHRVCFFQGGRESRFQFFLWKPQIGPE
jgi:hypothetical protein